MQTKIGEFLNFLEAGHKTMMSEKNFRPAGPSSALVRLAPSGPISPDDFNPPPPQVSPMAKYALDDNNMKIFVILCLVGRVL